MSALFQSLRIEHWTKNSLVFVPLLLSHRVTDLERFTHCLIAFVCFGLIASSGYLLNDLRDREFDRLDPVKKHRSIASGQLSVFVAVLMATLLLALAACRTFEVTPNRHH